ncbi:MAG TPA: EamA family transporter, partial [Ktedonobacteraceae bacterium]
MPIDSRSLPSPPQSRATFSWFLLISANVLWATSYVAGKLALQNTSVIFVLALRMSISSLILLPLLIVKRGELKLSRKDLPQL